MPDELAVSVSPTIGVVSSIVTVPVGAALSSSSTVTSADRSVPSA